MDFYLLAMEHGMSDVVKAKDRRAYLNRLQMKNQLRRVWLKKKLDALDQEMDVMNKLVSLITPRRVTRDDVPPAQPSTIFMGDYELHWSVRADYMIQLRRIWTWYHKREMYAPLNEAERYVFDSYPPGVYELVPYIQHPDAHFIARVLVCESKRMFRYWLEERNRLYAEIDALREQDPVEMKRIKEANDLFERYAPPDIYNEDDSTV
jgi:hypothetical protein